MRISNTVYYTYQKSEYNELKFVLQKHLNCTSWLSLKWTVRIYRDTQSIHLSPHLHCLWNAVLDELESNVLILIAPECCYLLDFIWLLLSLCAPTILHFSYFYAFTCSDQPLYLQTLHPAKPTIWKHSPTTFNSKMAINTSTEKPLWKSREVERISLLWKSNTGL